MSEAKRLRIQIDPEADTFLLDHVVDGSPLLPTVMQLDLVARAAAVGTQRPAGIRLRDIRVGPPVRFSRPGPRQLDLRYRPAPVGGYCELRSPGHGAPHLVARAEPAAGSAPRVPAPAGTVLLTVTGYRATDLGSPAHPVHAARLARHLASLTPPAASRPAGTAIPEGARR